METWQIVNEYRPKNYLEVGILNCETLYNVELGYGGVRVGVDIDPWPLARVRPDVFWHNEALRLESDMYKNQRTLVYRMSSDDFFRLYYSDIRFDVVFVDGFHEYGQCMKDIEGSLKLLSDSGVILLHDTNPLTEINGKKYKEYYEILRMRGGAEGVDSFWNGDVWKCLVELGERGFEYETWDVPHGVTVVTKCGNKVIPGERRREIDALPYSYFSERRADILRFK